MRCDVRRGILPQLEKTGYNFLRLITYLGFNMTAKSK